MDPLIQNPRTYVPFRFFVQARYDEYTCIVSVMLAHILLNKMTTLHFSVRSYNSVVGSQVHTAGCTMAASAKHVAKAAVKPMKGLVPKPMKAMKARKPTAKAIRNATTTVAECILSVMEYLAAIDERIANLDSQGIHIQDIRGVVHEARCEMRSLQFACEILSR